MKVDTQEFNMILCGLRCYQQLYDQCDGDLPWDLAGIASNCGQDEPLDLEEIDELCERLNCED